MAMRAGALAPTLSARPAAGRFGLNATSILVFIGVPLVLAYIHLTRLEGTIIPSADAIWLAVDSSVFADRAPWLVGVIVLLAEILAALLFVSRWYQRTGVNSDIEQLRNLAYAYRLGGTLALRAFEKEGGKGLDATSKLADYRSAIEEPVFYRMPMGPPFVLALVLVVTLGLSTAMSDHLVDLRQPHLVLLGPRFTQAAYNAPILDPALQTYQAGAVVCLGFAFLAALMWSIVYLTRRMIPRDITGHAYQAVSVRLVIAAIVGLFLYHLTVPLADAASGVGVTDDAARDVAILAAFAAGVMPQFALRFIEAKVRKWLADPGTRDDLDLEMIEGIDAATATRLGEAGVNDAQGLIATNPLRLTLHTPFPLTQIMDWVGQAFLLLQLKGENFSRLRNDFYVRTVWELGAICEASQNAAVQKARHELLGKLAAAGYEARAILDLVSVCPCYRRAIDLGRRMGGDVAP